MRALRRPTGARGPRWGLLLLTALQLVVALGVPTADALLEGASVASPLHVEGATEEACGAPHDHVFCQLCRVLSLSAIRGHGFDGKGLAPFPTPRRALTGPLLSVPGFHHTGSPDARAPPRA